MIELVCVRHGRTAWNADLRFQGHSDIPLDGEGRAQAQVLASALRSPAIALGISSDLERASETARIILAEHGRVPLRLDPDLREMAFGAWEGLTWAQILESDPALAADGFHRPKQYVPPGGEAFEDVVVRATRALERIRGEAGDGTRVLVVTHAGVLHAMLRVVLGEAESAALDVRFDPGSVTRFALERDGGRRLLALNQAG